jgi:hypothetical protein
VNFSFTIVVEVGKDSPVLSQQPMNVSYKIVSIAVKPVVVIIPALIGTEFFISTSANGVTAIETFLFHSTKSFDKDTKKRFQTDTNDYK